MNRKKNLTVILFTFSLIILVALQAYYIYNSYRLEEKDLNRQAKEIAAKVMDGMDKFDTNANDNRLVGDFERLKLGIKIQNEKIQFPDKIYSSEIEYSKKMESLLIKNVGNSGFEMAMKNEIYSVLDELKNEDLLPKGRSITLFQTVKKIQKPMSLTESIWSSHQSKTNTDLNVDESYNYLIKSKASYQLLNIQYLVLKKIIPLVIISLLIIILIVYLFYKSIRNLNRQENKILQLHTTIDSIAHELNTPITTLKFSIVQTPDSETRSLLERQIARLENIVKSIHYSESDSLFIDQNAIEKYVSDLQKRDPAVNFKVSIDFKNNHVIRHNDFVQIMDNLIDNSVKYGAENLDVVINDQIEILVSDDGIGIPKEDHKLVFEKYYRVVRNENMNVNGLGVGLFLVKTTLDQYKGKITVKSNADKGVTFKIEIPNEN
jgi:two-component system phosphate regulon sensor histidine kinase PhoR